MKTIVSCVLAFLVLCGCQGPRGLSCWDLNSDGVATLPAEDMNGDGVADVLDCRGPQGPPGTTVPGSSSAICVNATYNSDMTCFCPNTTVSRVQSNCTVTSDTGTCSATSALNAQTGAIRRGACCVCR